MSFWHYYCKVFSYLPNYKWSVQWHSYTAYTFIDRGNLAQSHLLSQTKHAFHHSCYYRGSFCVNKMTSVYNEPFISVERLHHVVSIVHQDKQTKYWFQWGPFTLLWTIKFSCLPLATTLPLKTVESHTAPLKTTSDENQVFDLNAMGGGGLFVF